MTKLYIGNIPSEFDNPMISDLFKDFDGVRLLQIKRTGFKVYGFIQCNDDNQKEIIISEMNNKEISGRKLIVHEFRGNSKDDSIKKFMKSKVNGSDSPPPLIPITMNEDKQTRSSAKMYSRECNPQDNHIPLEMNSKEISGPKSIGCKFRENSKDNHLKKFIKSKVNASDSPPPLIPIIMNEDKQTRSSAKMYSSECNPKDNHIPLENSKDDHLKKFIKSDNNSEDCPPPLIPITTNAKIYSKEGNSKENHTQGMPIMPHSSSAKAKETIFNKNNLTGNYAQKNLNSKYDVEDKDFLSTKEYSKTIKNHGKKKNQNPTDKKPNLSHPFLNNELLYLSIMNFPYGTTRGQLYDLVGDFDPKCIYMVYDGPNEINHPTLAFISFDDHNVITNAILELDKTQYRRRILYVEDVDIDYVAEIISYKHNLTT